MSGGEAATSQPGADPGGAAEAIELALRTGRLLMDNGAESERVERTVRDWGIVLGCAWSAVLVTYDAIFISELSGNSYRTKVGKVRPSAVNMSLIEQVSHLDHRVLRGELSRVQLRREIELIEQTPRHYSAPLTMLAIGLACAAFSRLFQGDWGAFAETLIASTGTMWVRHHYAKRAPNRLIFCAVSAAIAASIVGALQASFTLSQTPSAACVACALMLVPGVPAINAAQDLIKGYLVVGLARAAESALIILAATLGLLIALSLTQVQL